MLEYKGYRATYEPHEGLLTSHVIGTPDVITFVGQTPAEVEEAFPQSVDDYLDFRRERGELPAHPPSGDREHGSAPELARAV